MSTGGGTKDFAEEAMLGSVNKVFTTLRVTYPAWYEKYYGDIKTERLAKRIWLAGLKQLTSSQIDQGLQRMVMECDYPPKLRDFIILCKRIDGIPGIELAWGEALIGKYSHNVVKAAAELTGIFELRVANYDHVVLRKRFEYYFLQVIDNFIEGKELNQVIHALEVSTTLLDKVEQQLQQQVEERIKEQGIELHTARQKCLAILGIKRSQYKE